MADALARNTRWNLLGIAIPMAVAILCIPALIKGLGVERFGVLAVCWMVMGYFGICDFGLGQSTTKYLSEALTRGESRRASDIVWTSLAAHAVLGTIGGAILALLTPWLIRRVFNIPAPLIDESLGAVYLLAATVPLVVLTTCMRSLLEAAHRFDLVNTVKIPAGILNYAGPALAVAFTSNLVAVVGVIAASRLLMLMSLALLADRAVPTARSRGRIRTSILESLISLGGWLTVSTLVTPIIAFTDRFLIAAIFSIEAITFYVTPYEVVTKLWVFSAGLLGVLFPVFSALAREHPAKVRSLGEQAFFTLLVLVTPLVAVLLTYARELLWLWVGTEFALYSASIAKWLALGVLVNVLAQVPYTMLQAAGRADTVARLQLIELPCYLAAAWYLVTTFGSVGAAMAWAARAAIEAVILAAVAYRAFPASRGHATVQLGTLKKAATLTVFLMAFWAIDSALLQYSPMLKLGLFGATFSLFLTWLWAFFLTRTTRIELTGWLRGIALSR